MIHFWMAVKIFNLDLLKLGKFVTRSKDNFMKLLKIFRVILKNQKIKILYPDFHPLAQSVSFNVDSTFPVTLRNVKSM